LTEAQANTNNAAAQARVNSDQQQLQSAEAQASSNITTAQNQVNTAASQLTSSQASANANVTNEQGLVNAAQSQLQSALVQLQTAKHNLLNATLRAPHDGIITAINGTVGGTPGVPANATAGTVASASTFIQIADITSLQVQANVNETDAANLRIGEPAQFTVSAYANRIFTGMVSAISPFGQTVSNVVSYPVTIDVDMNNLQGANLLPNMTASVTIIVVQRPKVLLIPVNAVNFARNATGTVSNIPPLITNEQASAVMAQARQMLRELQNENPSISQDNPIPAYVLERPEGQSAFIPVPVVLGLTDDTYYVVLNGLSLGDIIVVGAQIG
ncbi:MAG TPA: efflux RND transporter periplasmic adaptor subunit, partial [Ktedonobacteraceae bacterium]